MQKGTTTLFEEEPMAESAQVEQQRCPKIYLQHDRPWSAIFAQS
jgi:hypothetical protein